MRLWNFWENNHKNNEELKTQEIFLCTCHTVSAFTRFCLNCFGPYDKFNWIQFFKDPRLFGPRCAGDRYLSFRRWNVDSPDRVPFSAQEETRGQQPARGGTASFRLRSWTHFRTNVCLVSAKILPVCLIYTKEKIYLLGITLLKKIFRIVSWCLIRNKARGGFRVRCLFTEHLSPGAVRGVPSSVR